MGSSEATDHRGRSIPLPGPGRREPFAVRIAQDAFRAWLLLLWAGLPLGAVVWAQWVGRPWWVAVAAGVLAHFLGLLLARASLPKTKPGEHLVQASGPYLLAALARALAEVAFSPVFRGMFWFFAFGRVVHLKLLGAKLPWDVGLPASLSLRDPALLELGVGTVVEPGVVIEASTLRAGRAHVGEVSIGDRCVIGAEVILLPGVVIAHDVRVEPGALLADDVRVGVFAIIGPGVRVARGVKIGAHASVGAGAVLGEGASIGERARVVAGAFVPAGTRIEAHARFQG